jgi:hypothetical protein
VSFDQRTGMESEVVDELTSTISDFWSNTSIAVYPVSSTLLAALTPRPSPLSVGLHGIVCMYVFVYACMHVCVYVCVSGPTTRPAPWPAGMHSMTYVCMHACMLVHGLLAC